MTQTVVPLSDTYKNQRKWKARLLLFFFYVGSPNWLPLFVHLKSVFHNHTSNMLQLMLDGATSTWSPWFEPSFRFPSPSFTFHLLSCFPSPLAFHLLWWTDGTQLESMGPGKRKLMGTRKENQRDPVAARFEPLTSWSKTWLTRPQDHSVLPS